LIRRARALAEKGKHQQACQLLSEALAIQDSGNLRGLLGVWYEKAGLLPQAIEQVRQASDLQPDVAWYQDKLGLLYVKQNQIQQACAAFAAALEIKPDYAKSKRHLRRHCQP
jgi:tetratricopeptide (TPR) repeat protein